MSKRLLRLIINFFVALILFHFVVIWCTPTNTTRPDVLLSAYNKLLDNTEEYLTLISLNVEDSGSDMSYIMDEIADFMEELYRKLEIPKAATLDVIKRQEEVIVKFESVVRELEEPQVGGAGKLERVKEMVENMQKEVKKRRKSLTNFGDHL
ncbi:hypothetical protein BDQ17DRAFT_1413126 [Cyathus striatus]|nr:hypothetical protein BDQ17DRAFT_1413126 [Cyathus striatus]